MNKITFILFTFLATTLSGLANAEETCYISDNLSTYLHGGPNNNFRIIGIIASAEEVTVLETNQATKFARIRDSKGKIGWLPLDQLSATQSIRVRVPALEEQVKTLTKQLKDIDASWQQKTAEMQKKVVGSDTIIVQLEQENNRLSSELSSANKKADDISLQIDDKQRDIIQQWFIYGGSVAGCGLLLGLLLPYLIPRRKAKDRWMN